jgi:hypothetical protein
LSQELPVGADATNATEQLYSLVGDDILFDQLQDLAEQDANADCRNLVIARIKDMSNKGFEDFDTVLDALRSEQLAPPTVAPEAPPAPVAEQDDEEYSVDGGMNNELLQDDEEPGSCNYTAEGEHCPEHGLMECGSMYEGEQDTISRLQELSGMNNSQPDMVEGMEDSPVAGAITRRILMQRADLLSKYGPEKVTAAIDEVADFVGDVEEIGSSDVSGWIKQVEQSLAGMAEEVAVTTGNPPLEETVSLQGQYGHSGKLQKFDDVEEDVLHRLRQLSGMIRS